MVTTAVCVGALLLLVGVVLFAAWMMSNSTEAEDLPEVVERVFPGRGDAMLRQGRVGLDLQATYWCSLTIDGTVIPDDQLEGYEETGECFYRPGTPESAGEEKAIVELEPGSHTATAEIYSLADPTDRTFFTWSFDVL